MQTKRNSSALAMELRLFCSKPSIGGTFMDLSKAFDHLPHGLLTGKRPVCGLNENAWDKKWNTRGFIIGPLLFNL